MKRIFPFLAAVSFSLLGCVMNPRLIQDLEENQTTLETRIDMMSRDMEQMKRQLEIQKTEIENIESVYSNINKRLERFEKRKTTDTAAGKRSLSHEASTDNLYELAEYYYMEGRYVDAILAYQSFIDSRPNDKRVADAYLKQGLSLVKTGRKNAAKFFFKTVVDRFPNSPEARRASSELEKIR